MTCGRNALSVLPPRALAALAVAALLGVSLAVAPGALAEGVSPSSADASTLVSDPAQYVDTLAGTGSGGSSVGSINNFPGPAAPFGMVQFSPDTGDSYAGYSYGNTDLKGFSLTHASVGCTALGDFPVLPTTGAVGDRPWERGATISKDGEVGQPGYYGVTLSDTGVKAELTAGTRVGVSRFAFPDNGMPAQVFIRPGSSKTANSAASLQLAADGRSVTGSTTTGGFCGKNNTYTIHFALQFDQPVVGHGTWDETTTRPDSSSVDDAHAGGWFTFPAGSTVTAKVALSYTSTDAAQKNLQSELPGSFDTAHASAVFDATRRTAYAAWTRLLSTVRVASSTPADGLRTFYHSLYRSFLHPNTFSDADGRYVGFDGKPHRVATGHVQYANYSDWDTYRSLAPLQAMLVPDVASDLAQSLVSAAQQMGSYPRWGLANSATGQQTGDSTTAFIASLHAFGATDFDTATALRYMRKSASDAGATHTGGLNPTYVERAGGDIYNDLHYAPQLPQFRADHQIAGASITLEWAVDDFAIGRFAGALGETSVAASFQKRGQWWQNILNPATRYLSPRDQFGAFADGPGYVDPSPAFGQAGFDEGNAEQYLWLVPQNVAGLTQALGGRDAVASRLDAFMTHGLNVGPNDPFMWAGNEPNFSTPWLYDYVGRPWRTTEVVDQIRATLFGSQPDGAEPGNDDLGAQSSWYVWAALGLFPATPGTDVLAVNTPAFDKAVVQLGNGGTLTLRSDGATTGKRYIDRLSVDGSRSDSTALPSSVLAGGSHTVTFGLTGHRTSWGTSPQSAPPSFGEGSTDLVASATPAGPTVAPGGSVGLDLTAQAFTPAGRTITVSATSATPGITTAPVGSTSAALDRYGRGGLPLRLSVGAQVPDGWHAVTITVTAGSGAGAPKATTTVSVHVTQPDSIEAARTVVGTSPEADPVGDFDAAGNSYSREKLASEGGLTPGSTHTLDSGETFTWPAAPVGRPDTIAPSGQRITLTRPATSISFVGAGINSGGQDTATVTLDDGSTAQADFSFGDWVLPSDTPATGERWPREPVYGNSVVAWTSMRNGDSQGAYVFATTPYAAPSGRTVVAVTLPTTDKARVFTIATR